VNEQTMGPAWVIDEADVFAVPRAAHCGVCGFEWVRPESDHQGDTLGPVASAHNRAQHAGERMTWARIPRQERG
jgi:hypothetical protein